MNTRFVAPASRRQLVFWLTKQRYRHLAESTQTAESSGPLRWRHTGSSEAFRLENERSGWVSYVLLAPFCHFCPSQLSSSGNGSCFLKHLWEKKKCIAGKRSSARGQTEGIATWLTSSLAAATVGAVINKSAASVA